MRSLLAAFALSLALFSSTTVGATPQAAFDIVRSTSDQMLVKLREEKSTHGGTAIEQGRIYELVNEIVLPHFDFDRIARWVLGKHWRKASSEQQQRFTEEFRVLLVRTYASALNEYTEDSVSYLPLTSAPDAEELTVRSEVAQPGGFPVTINYDMYVKQGEWKVYDVAVDGVSLVANYRTTFSKEIRERGIDGLIDALAARNQQGSE